MQQHGGHGNAVLKKRVNDDIIQIDEADIALQLPGNDCWQSQ